ncbi:unnamed protein product [Rhizophagus irregularis]|nr:unnamed protein product [Rhizophagus irregularis]
MACFTGASLERRSSYNTGPTPKVNSYDLHRYVEVQPTFRKKLSRKITQNKEIHYTMTDNNGIEITLNCLIVPVGNLIGVPCSEVNQAITIRTNRPRF